VAREATHDAGSERGSVELQRLRAARGRGTLATLRIFASLSGPGWLQSAVTLGGGSLASSLYLGVLGGFSLLWLQPLAMLLGIVMLSAISSVTLTTGVRPLAAMREHVSPVLAWGWVLATLAANMVWSLPQYALATGVVQQNLAPDTLGAAGPLGDFGGKALVVGLVFSVALAVAWSHGSGARGVRLFERALKCAVALIVLSFVAVVVRLALSSEGLDVPAMLAGFVPDFRSWSRPSADFDVALAALGAEGRAFWSAHIVAMQRDVMIAAAATAVGINMTFLLPYSLLARGWGREHAGLARFDLSIGMFLPFVLATSCVVVAAASRFHTQPVPGLEETASKVVVGERLAGEFEALLAARAEASGMPTAMMPAAERRMAAMLVKRDAQDLAQALAPLTGDLFANLLFGLGVLAMALSTSTLLMHISGLAICEMLGVAATGWPYRLGCLASATGVLGPFLWKQAQVWLAMPTSIFGMILLPIAYWSFLLMMNKPRLLGAAMPRGLARVGWNGAMGTACLVATGASLWSVVQRAGWIGLGLVGVFVAAVFLGRARGPRERGAV
jgi:Mn2+/Fe2+ NRAMP family transporter